MGKVQPAAIDTGWIDAGLPVSAGNLAANLNGLQSQSTALQNQLSFNGTYSLGADFCKETPGNFTGAVVAGGTGENGAGWAAAKAACVTTCGGSSTAHMCTTEELVRHFALGEPALTPNSAAWFASGVLGTTASGGDSDCYGWTVGDSTSYGGLWEGYYSTAGACNGSFPIACCDWP